MNINRQIIIKKITHSLYSVPSSLPPFLPFIPSLHILLFFPHSILSMRSLLPSSTFSPSYPFPYPSHCPSLPCPSTSSRRPSSSYSSYLSPFRFPFYPYTLHYITFLIFLLPLLLFINVLFFSFLFPLAVSGFLPFSLLSIVFISFFLSILPSHYHLSLSPSCSLLSPTFFHLILFFPFSYKFLSVRIVFHPSFLRVPFFLSRLSFPVLHCYLALVTLAGPLFFPLSLSLFYHFYPSVLTTHTHSFSYDE